MTRKNIWTHAQKTSRSGNLPLDDIPGRKCYVLSRTFKATSQVKEGDEGVSYGTCIRASQYSSVYLRNLNGGKHPHPSVCRVRL